MRPAVFLDRDDTLIENRSITAGTSHPGDLFDPALVRLLPGADEACARLARAGFALVVVTNQAAVARGHCTVRQVEATNDRLRELLAEHGVALDGVYYSPFLATGVVKQFRRDHAWRKPRPGMIEAAARELELDLARSWMIGDSQRDIDCGIAAGIAPGRCLRIGDGPADLRAAADLVLVDSPP